MTIDDPKESESESFAITLPVPFGTRHSGLTVETTMFLTRNIDCMEVSNTAQHHTVCALSWMLRRILKSTWFSSRLNRPIVCLCGLLALTHFLIWDFPTKKKSEKEGICIVDCMKKSLSNLDTKQVTCHYEVTYGRPHDAGVPRKLRGQTRSQPVC